MMASRIGIRPTTEYVVESSMTRLVTFGMHEFDAQAAMEAHRCINIGIFTVKCACGWSGASATAFVAHCELSLQSAAQAHMDSSARVAYVRVRHAARCIQRAWRRAVECPRYAVCQRRLAREFEVLASA
jgi:hypothetical protein